MERLEAGNMLTLKQHVCQVILEKIESGTIGPGSRLSDEALAKEIGVSRSPVREAINQLATRGLVEYRPRRGAFVRAPGREELEQLYEARVALEGFAAAKAARRLDANGLARLEAINRDLLETVKECRNQPGRVADRKLTDRFLHVDLDFHLAVLDVAGNPKIMDMVRECKLLMRVFAHVPVEHDLRVMSSTYRQHSSIIRSIRAGDPEVAKDRMTRHIEAACETVLAGYDRAVGQSE